jgi:hypothetical protein
MTDMSKVIVPKSDQINADDLIAGPRTIRIREVSVRAGQDQPVSVFYDGDDGKPYKPCKSMCRVMVLAWGADAKAYAGRSMTLYRDPTVKWGGMEVGGIRISHMSDMDRDLVMSLTATKGSRKPYKVQPLNVSKAQAPREAATLSAATLSAATNAAKRGMNAYREWFSGQPKDVQSALVNGGHHDTNKASALEADSRSFDQSEHPAGGVPQGSGDAQAPSGSRDGAGSPPSASASGGEPSEADREAAFQAGVTARANGLSLRKLPEQYRDNDALADAWERGHGAVDTDEDGGAS